MFRRVDVMQLTAIPTAELVQAMKTPPVRTGGGMWEIHNEIRPLDLYCYLQARFGDPNGIQNILRADDSDNMFHWEWTLRDGEDRLSILGLNFRTEVVLFGPFDTSDEARLAFIREVKTDLSSYGTRMKAFRQTLEKWTMAFNPFHRIDHSIRQIQAELKATKERMSRPPQHPTSAADFSEFSQNLAEYGPLLSLAAGQCFGLRMMIPVWVESFVNVLIFVLAKESVRTNQRLLDGLLRNQIDIRTQTLHLNCNGFDKALDPSAEEYKRYLTLVNERNDLLHGNFTLNKLKYDEVYFRGTVPIFKAYGDFASMGYASFAEVMGLGLVDGEIETARAFIEYVYSCLDPRVASDLREILERRDFGVNEVTKRVGVLFPEYLHDFRLDQTAKK